YIVQHRILHGDLQTLALAGAALFVQCTQYGDAQQHAGAGIADGGTGLDRTAVGFAADAHGAAGRLRNHVEGEVVGKWAAFAETLHLRIDDGRVQLGHNLIAQAQTLDRSGRKILDEDIGPARKVED